MTAEEIKAPRSADSSSMDSLRARHKELADQIVAGRREAVERQRGLGKLTARERLDRLFDEGSFAEAGRYRRGRDAGPDGGTPRPYTDGVITAAGTVAGKPVFAYAQDFAISGGSLGEAHAAKIHRLMDLAIASGAPLIALNDSGGARIQEGAMALDGYGGIFRRNVLASGVIPQISVVMGPCAGGAAYSPALTDFTFLVAGTAQMYLTGPDVVATVTGQRVTHEELGGAEIHGKRSGVATFVCPDEETCLEDVRRLLGMLPSNYLEFPPSLDRRGAAYDERPALADIVPADSRKAYDMREVVAELADDDADVIEVQPDWGTSLICALTRIDGDVAGIVANQPLVMAGVLDSVAAQKGARFVRFCDAFNIPLVTLVDVPGFMPGADQEQSGIIRHGAKLLYAYCEATVPRIQVIIRKAFGGAYIVMDSRSVGADVSLAWPTNEVAVMGAAGAVNVIHRKELAEAADPETLRARLEQDYTRRLVHPYYCGETGLADDVIDPGRTRAAVARWLAVLKSKRKFPERRKHGNIPL